MKPARMRDIDSLASLTTQWALLHCHAYGTVRAAARRELFLGKMQIYDWERFLNAIYFLFAFSPDGTGIAIQVMAAHGGPGEEL
jgi:hypothetical protein